MRTIPLAAAALLAAACASTNPPREYPRPTETNRPAATTTREARSGAASEDAASAAETARSSNGANGANGAGAAKPNATNRPPSVVEASADVVSSPVVARVAGEEIPVGELLAFWLHNRSIEVREMLEHLVSAELITLEARRLGVEVDPELVDLGLVRTRQEIEEQIRREDPTSNFNEFVEVRLGLDSERYESQLRREVERKLLGERVVRAFVMGQPHTELNVIVVRSKAEADAAMERIQAGEEFAVVARDVSLDPSAERGGRIPPVLRNGSVISELAFRTPVGKIGGPIEENQAWLIAQIVGRPEPVVGDWALIGEQVEESLREFPLEDPEYWQWKSEMRRSYQVDLTPFFELVGEPALR